MNLMIVDDEHLARDRIRRMLDGESGYEVVGQAANGMEAVQLAQQIKPDLVLMDIRMPGMDGLEAARHISELEEPPAVIFCTAYEEHAIEAFNVQAVGYLLKPVRKADLSHALENAQRANKAQLMALAASEGNQRSHISARTRRGVELVPIDDVLYFRADQKYVTVRHAGGELLIDETLRELEEEFGPRFLRVHRNALVSVRHIQGLERLNDGAYQVALRDLEERVDVSRRHVSSVRKTVKNL